MKIKQTKFTSLYINKIAGFALGSILMLFSFTNTVFGQAFSISYPGPQNYTVGSAISSLTPSITGGPPAAGGVTAFTLAGSGSMGYNNANGTSASFNLPTCVVADKFGNIYVGDSENNVIRKITPSGSVSTYAGNGTAGSANGPLLSSSFQHPAGITIDDAGNLYVADQYNHKIRKVGIDGQVTTIAGTGTAGSTNGSGSSASFNNPSGVAINNATGDIYVVDYYNNRIRLISGGIVSNYAGTGSAGFSDGPLASAAFNGPFAIAISSTGILYVADRLNYRVRKITGGNVTTFAGSGSSGAINGTGTGATFNRPTGIAIDASGNLYVSDENNNMIRKITSAGVVSTLAGSTAGTVNGTGSSIRFNGAYAITIDNQSNLYLVQLLSHTIRKIVTQPYVIYPSLPAGLNFNNTTGVISGTPTASSGASNYFIQAFNLTQSSSIHTWNMATGSTGAGGGNWGSNDQNYVVTYTPRESYTTAAEVYTASVNRSLVNIDIQYLDGLGRPMQEVAVQASPGLRDIVKPIAYDEFGRKTKDYLPYPESATNSDGTYKSSAITEQSSFYTSPGAKGVPEVQAISSAPFSETKLESSPLSRVMEQGFPGPSWKLGTRSATGSRTQIVEYTTNNQVAFTGALTGNTGSRKVAKYGWTRSGIVNTLIRESDAFYSSNELFVTISKNENWQATDGCFNTVEEYKDKLGRVVLKRTYNNDPVVEMLSTYYVYDDLGNLVFVLPPASNPDRLTGVPDASQLNAYCYQYYYDDRNRIVEKRQPGKGWENMIYNNLDQLVFHQSAVQESGTTNEQKFHTFNKYDAFGRIVITGVEKNRVWNRVQIQNLFENQVNNFESRSIAAGHIHGYTNLSMPGNAVDMDIHIVSYYDNYDIPDIPAIQSGYSSRTKGLLTATKTKVLGTSDYLWTIYYYNDRGEQVNIWKQHYLSGTVSSLNFDQLTNLFTFTGKLKNGLRQHKIGTTTTTILKTYNYDHSDRPTTQLISINGAAAVTLSKLEYNELGQLKRKGLHSTNGSTFLENIDYRYNARGWAVSGQAANFSYWLRYDEETTNKQFNGNIAYQSWGAGSVYGNRYTYTYDKLNRLRLGSSTGVVMKEAITYDNMGNISKMKRDNDIEASYQYNGNQLTSILDGPMATGTYQYDLDGNAKFDGRTGVALTYNSFNLPVTATKTGLNLSYLYDGSGNKLRKINAINGNVRHYVDGIEYDGNNLDIIQTDEGIIRKSGTNYVFEYNLTDHLGNVRFTFTTSGGVLARVQNDDYYPFGKRKSGLPISLVNNYLYNGKEMQPELGEQYDYGARFYDPVIGRWNSVDPLAELFDDVSPYNYGLNNPILMIDPDGMAADTIKTVDLSTVYIIQPPKVDPFVGFWGEVNYLLTGGRVGNFYYDRNGSPTGPAPVTGMPPDLGFSSGFKNVNTIYKGIKKGFPYIGKSFNLAKRYTKAEKLLMKIEPVLGDIKDAKLLRAIEQKVLEYKKTMGEVANKINAYNPKKKDYVEYMQKAEKWLSENAPNWKDLF